MDLENQYYNSKALKEDNPTSALNSFKRVLEIEQEKGEWGFRALKQMIKIYFKLVSGQPEAICSWGVLWARFLFEGRLHGNDEEIQRAAHLYQERGGEKLLGKVHQLHSRLHLNFETGKLFS